MVRKTSRKLESGIYTVTDIRWGMTLDLSDTDNQSLIVFRLGHIDGKINRLIVTLSPAHRTGPSRDASTEVVAGQFPMCSEMEIMNNGIIMSKTVTVTIQLPHIEMALGFNGGHAGVQRFLTKDASNVSTLWRLLATRAGCEEPANLDDRDHPTRRNNDSDNHNVTTTTTTTVTRIVTSDA
ncbi:hypothetical protein EDB87DRAFT_1578270 [Lactarius vividus]|nr:hypothetical protein EDB87DRAFT_1578270 [Lactarius vividus]